MGRLKSNNFPRYVPQSAAGRYWWLAGFVVSLAALLLYGLTRFGQFQGEDLTMLGQLRGPKQTFVSTLGFFTQDWGLEGKYYAPLPRLLFFFEYRYFTINPAGWHIVSALLHALAAALVWGLAWKLTRRPLLALCAGLFFALQPAHVPVVAQVTGQADILAAIFSLASAICFVSYRQQGSAAAQAEVPARPDRFAKYYLPLSVVFYGLALLCKQEAIALPLALLAYDFITGAIDRLLQPENEQAETARPGQTARSYIPFLVLFVLYIALSFAFLGGLSAFLPGPNQKSNLVEFLRGNLRYLAQPFGLGGTDGLILLAALGAFLALTGVQEWEAWQLNNPGLAKVKQTRPTPALPDEDDELDSPEIPVQNGNEPGLEPAQSIPVLTPAEEAAAPETAAAPVDIGVNPPYWALRTAGYGFLWTLAFLLPFALLAAGQRTLYLSSAGFAIFLAAALAPFGLAAVHEATDRERARALFGKLELSFWLRVAAVIAVLAVYFATTVGQIDEVNRAGQPFALALLSFLN